MRPSELQVLFEDNHLLAVVKPAGLLVQGDRTGDPTLLEIAKAWLRRRYGKPGRVYLGLVHRLDRPVSGVVLLARTSKAAGRLARQFREGSVRKIYWAVVAGSPEPRAGEAEAWLAGRADGRGRTRSALQAFPGARLARLRYRTVERAAGSAWLEVEPLTGRRHQIRVQLALLGHPILGDTKYGGPSWRADRRLALHGRSLEVVHPVGGQKVLLVAPPPEIWPWPPPVAGER
jgi:23S rRNA pseudouridine1911/1915/1917 synthase